VIATTLGFRTRIFDLAGQRLRLLSTVGAGNEKALSLFWDRDREHYKVLDGAGELDTVVFNEGQHIAHDPTGDGNCMYEAIYYIYREGSGNLGRDLAENPVRRASNN